MQNWKLKYSLIFIILLGCEKQELQPELNGIYINNGIELIFNNGQLNGETQCNSLNGTYLIENNNINISIKGTKVYCENEYDYTHIRYVNKYQINYNKLTLKSNSFEIILYKIN